MHDCGTVEASHARGSLHQARTYDGIGAVGRCMAFVSSSEGLKQSGKGIVSSMAGNRGAGGRVSAWGEVVEDDVPLRF